MVTNDQIYETLSFVHDPEIPVLSVLDLGMITEVKVREKDILIKMIPTFSACPAVHFIQKEIKEELEKRLKIQVTVERDKTIQWCTQRLSEAAYEKLRQFKIAPPSKEQKEMSAGTECPFCHSHNTYLRSPFGSTLCRALHYCRDCGHVFEEFKEVE
ncbi:MAG: 1,2-phenylacetyl-CoA epoxidase subunit PaaD [Chitinophagaceae bacterium]